MHRETGANGRAVTDSLPARGHHPGGRPPAARVASVAVCRV